MFLIEYDKGLLIDGEEINWLSVRKDDLKVVVKFTLKNEPVGNIYTVGDESRGTFINHLQILSGNVNVGLMYRELKNNGAI